VSPIAQGDTCGMSARTAWSPSTRTVTPCWLWPRRTGHDPGALHSRIYAWQAFKPLAADEVLATVPACHPVWNGVDPQVILWGDDRIAHGNFRSWVRLTSHVRDALEDDPTLNITVELLRWVLSQIDPTTRFGD
jgi:hypothetical protein